MSGPKVSVYTLERNRRAAIEAERKRRQLELERHVLLTHRIKEYIDDCHHGENCLLTYQLVAEEAECRLHDSTLSSDIEVTISKFHTIEDKLSVLMMESSNEVLESAIPVVDEQIKSIEKKIGEISVSAEKTEVALLKVLTSEQNDLFSHAQHRNTAITKDTETVELARLASKIQEHIKLPYYPPSLSSKLQELAARLNSQDYIGDISSFTAIEVQPLIKECDRYDQLWAKQGNEYSQLCARYEALMLDIGEAETVDKIPFDAGAIAKLKALIAATEDRIQHRDEQEYINTALSEVMTDMGYQIFGKRKTIKRNGQQTKSELYQYSDDTAVSVTYSSDGKIALELGKIDNCDRLPSDAECKNMVGQMISFCEKFPDIEARLAQRGVIIKNRVVLAPPSVNYAQIINRKEYSEVENSAHISRRKRETKKLRVDNT